MLTLQEISRHYKGSNEPAVDRVDLTVPHGEVLALVGQSGSGKTTLMRLISGLEIPDSGKILIDDEEVASADGRNWVPPDKRRVGLVFQDGALFPHLTIEKNVAYGLSAKEFSREDRKRIVDGLLETTGLKEYRGRFPHQLSGGERQRLAVARALAPKPKLMLLDEPFSNLDPALRLSIREEILTILRDSQMTAIIVTHDTDDALAIGDRIAVFRDCKIEQSGTPSEIFHHPLNGYCAKLFGPANCLHRKGDEPKWIRPDDMQLIRQKDVDSDIAVKLLSIRDAGRHREARVECLDDAFLQPEDPWIIPVSNHEMLDQCDHAWVRVG